MDDENLSRSEKIKAIRGIASYRPRLTILIIFLSVAAALFEGIGMSFIIPIIDVAQSSATDGGSSSQLVQLFRSLYLFFGIPFSLSTIILGLIMVMIVRFSLSFLVDWLREGLRISFIRDTQTEEFRRTLEAKVGYFDARGSDEILNAIITQTKYASRAINRFVQLVEQVFLSMVYLGIAFYLAPFLTLLSIALLGGVTFFVRNLLAPGYTVGDRVASANERVQEAVQAGTQGIRDVKLFRLNSELFGDFKEAIDQFAESMISLRRNEAFIENLYQLTSAITVFLLIFIALSFLNLSLGALAVFLFAMFRLAPRVSTMNRRMYQMEGNLPHFVRTRDFTAELEKQKEKASGSRNPPSTLHNVKFDDVTFSYNEKETVLDEVSFNVEYGEFIAFVGESGAGKSTIVALLAKMYSPDSGKILANDIPIEEFDIEKWRSKIAVVRQNPFIFNDTLRYNLTIGNRDVSQDQLDTVCEISRVSEFLDTLPNGYQTILGDDGVQLSGGQRQRVALARALLQDADVLILDEATSDLDSKIEEQIQREIEQMSRDFAIISIAHRLSTVKNADRIYTLEQGRIIEVGDHHELLTNEGKYAQLYSIQSTK